MNPNNPNESGLLMVGTNPPTPANKKKLLIRSADMDDTKLDMKKLAKKKLSRIVNLLLTKGPRNWESKKQCA